MTPRECERPHAGLVVAANFIGAPNLTAGGEVRTRHDLHELVDCELRVAGYGDASLHDLSRVVGVHLRGVTGGDARGSVDDRNGPAGREPLRFLKGAVEVRAHGDGAVLDFLQQLNGCRRESAFPIASLSRCVTSDLPHLAVGVDEWNSQHEFLCHAGER